LVSCSCDNKVDDLLSQASDIADENPDSAYHLLDSCKATINKASRKQKMKYELLKAETMNKTYRAMDTLRTMTDVADFYKRQGNSWENIEAQYLLGCVYRDKGDAPKALKYYKEAVSIADTSSRDCDYKQLSRIFGQIAALYNKQKLPQQYFEAQYVAYEYARKAKDTLAAINYFSHLAGPYHLLNKFDSAMYYNNKTIEMYERIGRRDLAAKNMFLSIDIFLRQNKIGDTQKAFEYIEKYGETGNNSQSIRSTVTYNFYKGLFFEAVHKLDSALIFYHKSIDISPSFTRKEGGYKGLLSVYQKLGLPDSVAKYAKLFADANDSASARLSTKEMSRLSSVYNYSESNKIAAEKSEENIFYKIALGFVLILLILVVILFTSKLLHLMDKREKEQKKEKEKYDKAIDNCEKLKEERNNIKVNADNFIEEKEKELNELRNIVAICNESGMRQESWNLEQTLMSSEIVKNLHTLALHGKTATYAEWNSLHQIVSKCIKDFYDALQNKNLTEDELNLAILIRLQFESYEAKNLLGLSDQRISNMRSRLNLKLFKAKGARTLDRNIRKMK